MATKAKPIPEGFHTITPHLTIRDAAKAIEFYQKAFGATEVVRMPAPDGKSIWHAQLKIGDSYFFMADEAVSGQMKSPQSLGGTGLVLQLSVEDADATFKRAVEAGATVRMPLQDMFWGDRYGQLADPFGFLWAVSTHVKDMTPEEMRQASAEAAKQFAKK